MTAQFVTRTRYAATLSPSHDEFKAAFALILERGRIWVADIDGEVHGFMAAAVQPAWFKPSSCVALEIGWWMDEEHRGRPEGVRLLFEFERWAKEQGAQAICMSDIVLEGKSAAERILTRLGYRITERTFTKGL
jgi:RimJ/RimL family protein N-acetyltransferase